AATHIVRILRQPIIGGIRHAVVEKLTEWDIPSLFSEVCRSATALQSPALLKHVTQLHHPAWIYHAHSVESICSKAWDSFRSVGLISDVLHQKAEQAAAS